MNLHETAMGQRFFNAQLPALINTLKDIAAALSRPAPSAISFPADPRFLTSLYYGEYEADPIEARASLPRSISFSFGNEVKAEICNSSSWFSW